LFIGQNESGKTTLLEFIRRMFFGFSHRRIKNNYSPLRGGSHGGRLIVQTRDGRRFTIARRDKVVTTTEEGGKTLNEEPSVQLLGGVDCVTFERVFAVGLKDLEGLDILTQDTVRGLLLGPGAGLRVASIPDTLKVLDIELGKLLKERGTSSLINNLVNTLKDIKKQIKEIQGQVTEYADCQKKHAQLEEKTRKDKIKAEQVRQRLLRIDQLIQAHEPWVLLFSAREKSANLESAMNFPPNGAERFENLKAEIKEIIRNKNEREVEAEKIEMQLGNVIVYEVLINHQDTIVALLGERGKIVSALEDYPTVKNRLARAEEEFHRRLRELGADWDSQRLTLVDTSVHVRQRVQEFGRKLDADQRKLEQTQAYQRTLLDAEKDEKLIVDGIQRFIETQPTPPIMDEHQLQQQQDSVRMIRSLLYQKEKITTQVDAKRLAKQESEALFTSIEKQMEVRLDPLPSWLQIAVLIIGVALAALMAVQRSYIPAVLILLSGMGLAVLLHTFRRRQTDVESARLMQLQQEEEKTIKTQRLLDEEVRGLEEQLDTLTKELEELALKAGIEIPKDFLQLERLNGELEGTIKQFNEWKTQERQKKEAERRLNDVQRRLQKANQETEEADRDYQLLQEEWHLWLSDRGFTDTIRPEGFEAILQAVDSARTAEISLRESQLRISQLGDYIKEAREKIRTLLAGCGRTPFKTEAGVEDLDVLRKDLDATFDAQRLQRGLQGRLEILRSEIERLYKQLEDKEAVLNELLQQANVIDEVHFYRMAESYTEWRECQKQIEMNELKLLTIVGKPEAQDVLERELGETDPLKLQLEKDRLHALLKEKDNGISGDEREIGSLNQRLSQMAQDKKLGELLFKQRQLREEQADATKRWTSLVVCRYLLEQARGIYERERQPQVIRESDTFLKTMTNSRYRLVSPVGEMSVQLEDTAYRRKEETMWSSGLADQVYLAIRFGLVRAFGSHAEPLPVILDDVLVKFDPIRQLGAAKVILDFARKQQVLLFSCHPEIKEIIEEAHKNFQFGDLKVAYFTLSDGVINRIPGSN